MMHLSPSQRRRQRAINAQAEEDAAPFEIVLREADFVTVASQRSGLVSIHPEWFGNRRIPQRFLLLARPGTPIAGFPTSALVTGTIVMQRDSNDVTIEFYNDKFGPPPQRGENRGPR